MNPEDKIKKLIEESKIKSDAQTEQKILGNAFENLEKLQQQKSPSHGPNIWKIIMKSQFTKIAAAAVLIIVVLSGLHMIGGSGIAWADVVEKFQSVEFFSAVFYEKDDALSQPEQIELWMGQGGSARVRIGSQVVFGKNGKVTDAFDITTRKKVEAENRAERMLEMLGTINGQFSLDTVLNVIARGSLTDVTPLINSEAIISEDLVVFDSQLYETQWIRIWALRESKLPVHIRIWGSRDGYCLDAFMNYSRKQPDEFFDPNAFEQVLSQRDEQNRTNIAYALLTDPGGKDITPKDMFKKSGYHMPVIKQAGITKEGAFWVIAEKARNRMPNGYEVHGFSKLEDDLGRTYFSVGGGFSLDGQTSYDIFIPIDFPFDERIPSRVTLTCDTSGYSIGNSELIGTVDLTDWEQDASYPKESEYSNLLSWKMSLANKLKDDGQTERLRRLLQEIPDWRSQPRSSSLLLFWIRKAADEMNFEKVIEIGEVLTTLLFEDTRNVHRSAFIEYLSALAATNKLEQAKSLFKRIDSVDKLSEESFYDNNLVRLIEPLIADANLTDTQIGDFLGPEYTKREGYESLLQNARRDALIQRARRAAQRRREEISEYYQNHPLPEKMELLERNSNENMYFLGVPKTVSGHEEYKIEPIDYPVGDLVSIKINHGDIQPSSFVKRQVDDQVAKQNILADLVYKDGIGLRERTEFVLNQFGLKLVVEEGQPRKVLVAKYNGQPLKNFKDVKAPLRNDNSKEPKAGMWISTAPNGYYFLDLLQNLVMQQNSGIKDENKKLVIVNETGIAGDKIVSLEMAYWRGPEGLELAKKWFKEQFGITFTEETRMMKTYVIRKKTN